MTKIVVFILSFIWVIVGASIFIIPVGLIFLLERAFNYVFIGAKNYFVSGRPYGF